MCSKVVLFHCLPNFAQTKDYITGNRYTSSSSSTRRPINVQSLVDTMKLAAIVCLGIVWCYYEQSGKDGRKDYRAALSIHIFTLCLLSTIDQSIIQSINNSIQESINQSINRTIHPLYSWPGIRPSIWYPSSATS